MRRHGSWPRSAASARSHYTLQGHAKTLENAPPDADSSPQQGPYLNGSDECAGCAQSPMAASNRWVRGVRITFLAESCTNGTLTRSVRTAARWSTGSLAQGATDEDAASRSCFHREAHPWKTLTGALSALYWPTWPSCELRPTITCLPEMSSGQASRWSCTSGPAGSLEHLILGAVTAVRLKRTVPFPFSRWGTERSSESTRDRSTRCAKQGAGLGPTCGPEHRLS